MPTEKIQQITSYYITAAGDNNNINRHQNQLGKETRQ